MYTKGEKVLVKHCQLGGKCTWVEGKVNGFFGERVRVSYPINSKMWMHQSLDSSMIMKLFSPELVNMFKEILSQ